MTSVLPLELQRMNPFLLPRHLPSSGHLEAGLPHALRLLLGTSRSGVFRCALPGGLCRLLRPWRPLGELDGGGAV